MKMKILRKKEFSFRHNLACHISSIHQEHEFSGYHLTIDFINFNFRHFMKISLTWLLSYHQFCTKTARGKQVVTHPKKMLRILIMKLKMRSRLMMILLKKLILKMMRRYRRLSGKPLSVEKPKLKAQIQMRNSCLLFIYTNDLFIEDNQGFGHVLV